MKEHLRKKNAFLALTAPEQQVDSRRSTWKSFFADLDLNASEQSLVSRYFKNPDAYSPFPLYEILKLHHLKNEALQFLAVEQELRPNLDSLKVEYAKALFERGLVFYAKEVVGEVRNMRNNDAIKLKAKLAFLFKDKNTLDSCIVVLKNLNAYDSFELRKWIELVGPRSFSELSEDYKLHLETFFHTELFLEEETTPEAELFEPVDVASPRKAADTQDADKKPNPEKQQEVQPSPAPISAPVYASSLADILLCSADAQEDHHLQSETLAQLYLNQGHYKKAYEIYARLRERFPSHEGIQKNLRACWELMQNQTHLSSPSDEAIVATHQEIGQIDQKMELFQKLIDAL